MRQLHQRKSWRTRYEEQRWLCFDRRAERKTVGHGKERERQRRRQGVEETAEKAKWCLCGVRKLCVLCLLIGPWS